jgi:ribosomal protein L37AE/L43A
MPEPNDDPTPLDLLIADWRSQVCPVCQGPLDLQQREPMLWFCAMCRKWFDEKLETL